MKIKDKILSETSEEVKQRVRDTANKLVMKQETLEEAAKNYAEEYKGEEQDPWFDFMEGAKWQQERSYSEEEVIGYLTDRERDLRLYDMVNNYEDTFKWFEQFKKK